MKTMTMVVVFLLACTVQTVILPGGQAIVCSVCCTPGGSCTTVCSGG